MARREFEMVENEKEVVMVSESARGEAMRRGSESNSESSRGLQRGRERQQIWNYNKVYS